MPTLFAIPFPVVDPVAFSAGPLVVRWYALAYIAGLLLAVWYGKRLLTNTSLWPDSAPPVTPQQLDDLLLWATVGVVIGGRAGFVLFYQPAYFAAHPLEALKIWQGGMSFHGGFLGVVAACWLYARRNGVSFASLLDIAGATAPIGLGLGRIANFINAELYGRVSDVPWAMVFPGGGPETRHPSQLYEAVLEGLVVFLAVRLATHRLKVLPRPGIAAGVFAVGYGVSRFSVEFVREPDRHLGFLAGGWLTMGMVLSLPLIALGLWLIFRHGGANREARSNG